MGTIRFLKYTIIKCVIIKIDVTNYKSNEVNSIKLL